MTTNAHECPSCGATADPAAARCEFCGRARTSAPAPRPASPADERAERIRRVEAHPARAEADRHVPDARSVRSGLVGQVVFGAFFAAFSSIFVALSATGSMRGGTSRIPAVLVSLLLVSAGVFLIVHARRRLRRFRDAPLRRVAAVIVGRRESRHGRRGRHVRHHVTLETADGARREFTAPPATFACAADGDAGVAFTQDEYLLKFRRIDA